MEEKQPTLTDKFQALLGSTTMGSEDAGLLELAAKFSLQLSAAQIRLLLFFSMFSDVLERKNCIEEARSLRRFVTNYLEYKKYHGSDFYVMRALDSVSLRKFIGQNPFNVDVVKK